MVKYLRLLAGLLAIAILTFGLHLFRAHNASAENFPTRMIGVDEKLVTIEVASGESGLSIAESLYRSGVTASVNSFYQLAINDVRSTQIAPGSHLVNLKISALQALNQLLDSKRNSGLISIVEGEWRSEIFADMARIGFSDFDNALKQLEVPVGLDTSEGIYFPAQYSFAKGTSTLVALQAMVNRFKSEAEKTGLLNAKDPKSALIIASLIQAEGDPTDFAKISRVIYNRLKIGMPLQLDTSVQYVLRKRGSIYLSSKATLINSPYNTYKRYGLPIGPIGNPGVDAIKAALNPATGDWLYFITVAPKDTRFTKSHDQFLIWKDLYLKNLRAGVFK